MAEFNTADEIVDAIDFNQLRESKEALVKTIDEIVNEDLAKKLSGILYLVDHIQDYAVDVLGKDENKVFSFEEEAISLVGKMKAIVTKAIQEDVADISDHDASECLIPDDEFMFNLSGTHYSGYVVDVQEEHLMSNMGNHYSYESLDIEQLTQLFDHLKKKYEL